METTTAFRGLRCTDCGTAFDPPDAVYRCPDCDGLLAASYDRDEQRVDADALATRDAVGPARYAAFLPFPPEATVSIDEGATPAVACPGLADELGVDALVVKDEGRNPTGSVTDRGLSLAVTAAVQRGATDVALPTTGNGGQSAAAYAGRAGIDSQSYVPTRCPFVNKAMVNVHGGEMTVVEGRYGDALDAYERDHGPAADGGEDARETDDGSASESTPVGPASPYRREGAKPLYFELVAAFDWDAPDAIVVPAGHGTLVAGIASAIEDFADAGLVDTSTRLYAAQPAGCAPIVEAWEHDAAVEPVDVPDTIVGPLEVADPVAGDLAVDALESTGGDAVAVDDDALLEAAADAASGTGVEVGATGGVAVAGARVLAEEGAFDENDVVALVDPVAGSKEADLLRSYLMSQGM